jgi:hypothetical protein
MDWWVCSTAKSEWWMDWWACSTAKSEWTRDTVHGDGDSCWARPWRRRWAGAQRIEPRRRPAVRCRAQQRPGTSETQGFLPRTPRSHGSGQDHHTIRPRPSATSRDLFCTLSTTQWPGLRSASWLLAFSRSIQVGVVGPRSAEPAPLAPALGAAWRASVGAAACRESKASGPGRTWWVRGRPCCCCGGGLFPASHSPPGESLAVAVWPAGR